MSHGPFRLLARVLSNPTRYVADVIGQPGGISVTIATNPFTGAWEISDVIGPLGETFPYGLEAFIESDRP